MRPMGWVGVSCPLVDLILPSSSSRKFVTALTGGLGARLEVLAVLLLKLQVFRDVAVWHWVGRSSSRRFRGS